MRNRHAASLGMTVGKPHTHYDNLKVARDAPLEVVRAAYKTLSQKYHPDKNSGDARAGKIMSLLNQAYAVLSDPDLRREHDRWIAAHERRHTTNDRATPQPETPRRPSPASSSGEPKPRPTYTPPRAPPREPARSALQSLGLLAIRFWPVTVIGGLLLFSQITERPTSGPAPYPVHARYVDPPVTAELMRASNDGGYAAGSEASNVSDAAAAATVQSYVRPTNGPNGEPWPSRADYLSGMPHINTDGLSKVTIDNGQNDADVLVKLVEITPATTQPVRTFFIPARASFTVENVDAGKYDIRYRVLDSGALARSEIFDLEEIPMVGATQYSAITMTLYKVSDGNMETYDLAEADF